MQELESSVRKKGWSALGWSYLYFWYFSGVFHLLLLFAGVRIFVGLRQAFVASALWLIPVVLFPSRAKRIAAVVGVVLWLSSLINLGYFFIYGQEFSQSVIFVIFESNAAEASEYISQYVRWWMLPAIVAYSAVAFLLWRRVRPVDISSTTAKAVALAIFAVLFVYPNAREIRNLQLSPMGAAAQVEAQFEAAVPWQIVFGYKQYRDQLAEVQKMLEQYSRTPPLKGLKDRNAGIPSTLVLVIGESTNREHMGLYGYTRPTTPRLVARRDSLAVFSNVVSSAAYTIGALKPALTLSAFDDGGTSSHEVSIVSLMKQAGYRTYWITNQLTVAKNNTILTSFSQQADQKIYLNNGKTRDAKEFDGKVLEPFKRILSDPTDRKFIIVHLLGTHMKYAYRYPPQFEVFSGSGNLPQWVTEDQLSVINSYDNAVLYNDFVVSSLIDMLDAEHPNGLLVYFSDHGEDVFDSPPHDTLGHNEDKSTRPMFQVPFILWSSQQWKERYPRDIASQLERSYSTSGFAHTWADLVGLSFDGFDPSKSLVSGARDRSPQLMDHIAVGQRHTLNGVTQ